jgi:hypothetical protein
LHHLLRMLQRNSARCRLHPEGAEYVEHFCGLDCYERFRHAPRPRQNLTLRLSLAVRSRQIEAYPNLMSDASANNVRIELYFIY